MTGVDNILFNPVAAQRSGRRHTVGRLPDWEAAPALRKYSFQNKITQQEKVSSFFLLVPWVSNPIPAITFLLLTSKSVRRWALRRRRSSALSPFYRDLGWEGTATWRTWPCVLSQFSPSDLDIIPSARHPRVRNGLSKCVLPIAQAGGMRCGARCG